MPQSSQTILVVDTTYDPATPYRGGKRLARDLGQTRLLTMKGDNHTAYLGNSTCIDQNVEAYLIDLTVPAAGTTCDQEVPSTAPQQAVATQGQGLTRAQARALRHAPPLVRARQLSLG